MVVCDGASGDASPRLGCVTTGISALIWRLDDPSADTAEDAKHALIGQGTVVIPESRLRCPAWTASGSYQR